MGNEPKPGLIFHENELDEETLDKKQRSRRGRPARKVDPVTGHPLRQCEATKRSGKQCKTYSVAGQPYCFTHGAASIMQAKANLSKLQNPVVELLADFVLAPGEPCVMCGRGTMTHDRLRAMEMILDRGGINAKIEMVHTGTVEISHELIVKRMTDEELQTVDEIMERVMQRVAAEEGLVNTVDQP